jgi:hypothetical protein
MSKEEAASLFAEEHARYNRVAGLMLEAKMDIETIVQMVDAIGAKALRKRKAEEFRAAFELPGDTVADIELVFYGDVEARIEAGRRLWKVCHEIANRAKEKGDG